MKNETTIFSGHVKLIYTSPCIMHAYFLVSFNTFHAVSLCLIYFSKVQQHDC